MIISDVKKTYPALFEAFQFFCDDGRTGKQPKPLEEELDIDDDTLAGANKLLSVLDTDELEVICLSTKPEHPFRIMAEKGFTEHDIFFLFDLFNYLVRTNKGIFIYS